MNVPIFKPWPFEKDEKVLLYWISSPWTDSIITGMCFVKVYFQRADASYKSVIYPWGNVSLLLMGYYYQNGRILDRNVELKRFTFKNDWIKEQHVENAKDVIPLKTYSLSDAKISFEEKCISLSVGNKNYIIPCIEMARAIYGMTPFFMETLLSTDGLSSFACFSVNYGRSLNVDFYRSYPIELFRRDQFLDAFVFLTQNKVISDWREIVYSQNSGNNKMVVPYPELKGASIVGYGVPCVYNKVLLLNISISGLNQPYEKVEFTHPEYVEPKNPTDKNRIRYINREGGLDENILLSGEETANKNRMAKIVSGAEASLLFPKISYIERKKTAGDKHDTKKVFIDYERQERFTTGPRVGNAIATPVESETIEREVTKVLEPGFEEFGKVIRKISKFRGVTNFSCDFYVLPDAIPIPNMSDGTKRKYALVKFEYYHREVCIIEICNVGFAISMLIVCGNDAEKNALFVLKSLEVSNGHWNKTSLFVISENSKIEKVSTLKHFESRTTHKWVELIINVIEKSKNT